LIGALRSLRVRLALTGSLAIYLPVVLVFAVTSINQREVTDIAPDGGTREVAQTSVDPTGWTIATVIALLPITWRSRGGGRAGRCTPSCGFAKRPSGSRPPT
jgi:hypothetical protein